ncbi:aminodeoxychorismate lyase [Paenisporosarcina quisquiliarum]|uniref:Aminodeoxychorismate lyase n=1 Tax=Paenisporosarcina quisquiliarum TaxID=365346 RepID=A0A9X3LL04_9BACL|nr:aminodeoxychorismate lyase [Paenisporosarcina quisquiliarum]
MWAWMNGEFVKADELRISPFDHGFLYGLGFFETFRTYTGQPFLLTEHLNRLKRALDEFRIEVELDSVLLMAVIQQLNERSGGEDGYFRLNVSAGVHDIGLAPAVYEKPTVILFRKSLPPMTRGKEKSAVWLETRRNTPESGIRYKSHHYANNVRARLELPSLAEQEGFFLTEAGHVAEGITSNIFWVSEDVLYTPSLETGILAGITRDWIISEAKKLGLHVVEDLFTPDRLEMASEVFISNAVQELVPIRKLGSNTFAGKDGFIYSQLHERYVEQVEQLTKERSQ